MLRSFRKARLSPQQLEDVLVADSHVIDWGRMTHTNSGFRATNAGSAVSLVERSNVLLAGRRDSGVSEA